MASAVTLIEATARIQRETGEVLLALAQRDDNETGVQRLKRVDDTLRALTAAPDSQLANTIKSHVRAVYRKLGVSSRRDAIQRGRELGIL